MAKPSLAVWKFSSCDGCQLSLLDLEDQLLEIAASVDIAHFPEATSAHADGPYTVSLVEGSVATPRQVERIRSIRDESEILVAIGACATSGGLQALRNLADVDEFISVVYPTPSYIDSLSTSTPISDHVEVDIELRGCPVSRLQLLELIGALLAGRKPNIPTYPVNAASLASRWRELGIPDEALVRALRRSNTAAPAFVTASAAIEDR